MIVISHRSLARQGSSMVYVLFIALVLAVAVVSLIHAVADVTMSGEVRRRRIEVRHAVEAASNMAMGRLRLAVNRDQWEVELFGTMGSLLDTTIDAGVSVQVKAKLEHIGSGSAAYDPLENPKARMLVETIYKGRFQRIEKEVKEANASDFAHWFGPGSFIGMLGLPPTPPSIWVPIFSSKGRVFVDATNNFQNFQVNFSPAQGTGPYFQHEVIVYDAFGWDNKTTVPDAYAFAGGIRSVTSGGSETPELDPDVFSEIDTVMAGGGGHYYNPLPTSKFQIRLGTAGTYDWRIVPNSVTPSNTFAIDTDYPWTTTPLPTGGVIKVEDSGGVWGTDDPIRMPRNAVTVAHYDINSDGSIGAGETVPESYYTTDGGVQVWADSAGSWTPYSEQSLGIPYNQANAYFSGQLTIASTGNIEIVGSIKYSDPTLGGDMLALVAKDSVYLHNDSFTAQAASSRTSDLHAIITCERGTLLALWNFFDSANDNAPIINLFGNDLRTPQVVLSRYIDLNLSAAWLKRWLKNMPKQMNPYFTGYQANTRTFDDRTLSETPTAFRKVWNLNPMVTPRGWDIIDGQAP